MTYFSLVHTQGITFCSSDPQMTNCEFPAHCVNSSSGFSCICSDGFVGDPSLCEDVNECTNGSHNCLVNTFCVNTAGSYNCSCNQSGYSYNGSMCLDINECQSLADACHKDAYCSNYDGNYTCTCVSGYTGNGTICIAPEKCQVPLDLIFLLDASGSVGKDNYVKEKEFIKIVASRYELERTSQAAVIAFSSRASNKVPLGSKNTTLSFASAVDNIPYVRGITRIDLALRLAYDEYFSLEVSNDTQKLVILLTDGIQIHTQGITFCSSDPQMTNCEFPAHCENTNSGFLCVCSDGFVGNPPLCEDVDECENLSRCAENATCTNLDGSYDCNCSAEESHHCFGNTLCDIPRVRITNVGRTVDQPAVVQLSSYYTFETNIEVRCAQIWAQNAFWILADPLLNDPEAILNGTIVSANTNEWTLSDHHLPFAHDLHALYFIFTIAQGDSNKTEEMEAALVRVLGDWNRRSLL
ncbi:fibrillin-2-like [Orbicella faveolata]|uniref:fibrillin-2-like n=1 Tax=Orbicella faveolata TaxID=48498 RepID=UPI0009E2806A|nr:fibrillin-2-like [Orbicella faveolata]